jgi:hypothetical protein
MPLVHQSEIHRVERRPKAFPQALYRIGAVESRSAYFELVRSNQLKRM